ncbi:MAG TPA: AAA family ATPase [Candidatus Paceibacterota bacterium]|nr:AAA family ATPase [Candidatus Paceibacterota bacterium]
MTQREALDILKTGANVFLTGAAGSGKTYVLNSYIDYLRNNGVDVGITASTGIAATHLGGVTIHSWTGLGVRDSLTPYDLEALEEKQYLWKRFESAKVLVIDEISMLHHFRLDLVDRICRSFKRTDAPFGGLQIVLCGDFFQLPPVARMGEEALSAYHSDAWANMGIHVCYLEEQWRQKDDEMIRILRAIRGNDVTDDVYESLRARDNAALPRGIQPTRLYTHNIDVDRINDQHLSELEGETHEYRMRSKGNPALVEALKKSCLAPEVLTLKTGTRVMFVKNNFDAGYVNGTLGVVTGFDDMGMPVVKTLPGETITADEMTWSVEEDGKIKAEVTQVPLRLAWAITVHKSQGMSLDAVEVDLSKSFVAGMGYVALSRVRTLAGLRLLGINNQALMINPEVLEFDRELLEASKKQEEWIAGISPAEKKKLHEEFIVRIGGTPGKKLEKKTKVPTIEVTRQFLLEKLSLETIAAKRELTVETIVSHIEKLREKDPALDIEHIRPHKIIIEKVKDAFKKAGDTRLTSAKNILGEKISFLEIRIARLFLDS